MRSPVDLIDLTKIYIRLLLKDPLSHRVIEKRRRDRMNSCLGTINFDIKHVQLCPLACLRVKLCIEKLWKKVSELILRNKKYKAATGYNSFRNIYKIFKTSFTSLKSS